MQQCLNCRSNQVREIFEGERIYYLCDTCHTKAERVFEDDGKIRIEKKPDGRYKHYSVAALIMHSGKYLLTKRRRYPFGYHFITGHVHRGEKPVQAFIREVFEETSHSPRRIRLLLSEEIEYSCRSGADWHHFYLYTCSIPVLLIRRPDEHIDFHYADRQELAHESSLTPITRKLFQKIGVIHE